MFLLQTWFRPCHILEAAHQTCQACQLLQLDLCNTKPYKSYRSYPEWHLELLKSTTSCAFPSNKMMCHQEVVMFRIKGWESLTKMRKQKKKQLKYWPKRQMNSIVQKYWFSVEESKGQEEEEEKDTCRFWRKICENKRNLGEQRGEKKTPSNSFTDSIVSRICMSIPVSEALKFCFSPAVFLIILACFLITCSRSQMLLLTHCWHLSAAPRPSLLNLPAASLTLITWLAYPIFKKLFPAATFVALDSFHSLPQNMVFWSVSVGWWDDSSKAYFYPNRNLIWVFFIFSCTKLKFLFFAVSECWEGERRRRAWG